MAHGKICRLCVTNSEVYESLYDDDGQKNEVYQLMFKFFDATLLNVGQARRLTCMCLKCWRTILDFHRFQQSVLKAQDRLLEDDNQFEEVHVKQEIMEDGPVKSKKVVLADTAYKEQCKKYNNGSENIQDEQKLALNYVYSDDGSTQDNKELHNDTESTLMKNEFLSASEDNDEELSSDENMLNEEEENINGNFNKDPTLVKTSFRNENHLQKKSRTDDFIAHWKPNLKCVVCLQLYPSYSLLQEHFFQNHPQAEFYILCCRRKFNNLHKITEHIQLDRCSSVMKCDLCNKSFIKRLALDLHMAIYHTIPSEENSTSHFDFREKIETANISEEEQLPDICTVDNSNQYGNGDDNVQGEQGKTFIGSKFELMDFFSDDGCTQHNENMSNGNVTALVENETQSESEDDDGPFCPNENSLIEKDDYKNKNSIDDKERGTVLDYDECIAKWMPNLECVVCSETRPTFKLLKQHFHQKHPREQCYIKCCRRKIKTRAILADHAKLHFDRNAYMCEICKISLCSRKSLLRHMRTHDDNANANLNKIPKDNFIDSWKSHLECVVCNDTYDTLTFLRKHFQQKHPSAEFYILCCERKLKDLYQIKEHILLHIDPDSFRCELCKKCFNGRSNLVQHMRHHHPVSNDGMREIPQHRRKKKVFDDVIRQWKSNLECELCGVTCPTFALLQEHFRQEHPQEQCYIVCCRRKLKTRYRIVAHIRVHKRDLCKIK